MDKRSILIVAVIAASVLLISVIGWAIVLDQTHREPIEASNEATVVEILDASEQVAPTNGENVTEDGQIIGDKSNIIKYVTEKTVAFTTPDVNSGVSAELNKGDSVLVTKHSTKGWCEINHNGVLMYVDAQYLTYEFVEDLTVADEDIPAETEVEEDTEPQYSEDGIYLIVNEEVRAEGDVWLHVAPKTSSKKVVILGHGRTATRVGVGNNGWSQIHYNDEILYVTTYWVSPTKSPKYDEVQEFVKLTESANLRENSSINSKKIAALPKGVEMVRIAIGRNGWSKVIYNGQIRYIYSLYITPIDREVTEADMELKN